MKKKIEIREILTSNAILVISALIMVCCAFFLLMDYCKRQKAEELMEEMAEQAIETKEEDESQDQEMETDTEPERFFVSVDFDMLHEINPDIYAWISVPGTNVNYPVLQSPEGEDTDYYLNTNLDGSSGYPGCIYTQLCNSKDFTDPVTILYGHNMRAGTMFATLHYYEDEIFFKENPYIYIYTEEQTFVYQIYASIWFHNYLLMDYYQNFESEKYIDNFIADISKYNGIIDSSLKIENTDKMIVLSTCAGSSRSNERYMVIGKLLNDEEVADIPEELKQRAVAYDNICD